MGTVGERGKRLRGTVLGVVVQNYQSEGFRDLAGACDQMRELCGVLATYGYTPTVVEDPTRDGVKRALKAWSDDWAAKGRHGPAVVLWFGHGVLRNHKLRLIVSDTLDKRSLEQTYATDLLVDAVGASQADQVLIMVDSCHAGAGLPNLFEEGMHWLTERTRPPGRLAWLGMVAGCQADQQADADGILLRTATQVLREGPATAQRSPDGSRHAPGITGVTLMTEVRRLWPQDAGQISVPVNLGDLSPLPMFTDPRPVTTSDPELVEHLVRAARGADRLDKGWFFSGRRRVLEEISAWLDTCRPGLLLVTGGAGAGKSAVLGRIWTLSDPEHRADVLAHAPPAPDDPDPGVDAVDAALHMRGLTVQHLMEALARALVLPVPATPASLIASVEAKWPPPGRPVTLILDGLDEAAPGQADRMATELLAPLSRVACVLLGSRDRAFSPQAQRGEPFGHVLSRMLGARARVIDLDKEADTAGDIECYSSRRLKASGLPDGEAQEAARLIAGRTDEGGGGFLLADLATDAVSCMFSASGKEDWNRVIPDSIGAAFDQELETGPQRMRDGRLLPHAAEALLTALAWSTGSGLPARGVWEAVASALGPDGTVYEASDVNWLLNAHGRCVIEEGDGVQAVFRLYHQELVAHLRQVSATRHAEPAFLVARTLVDLLRSQSADASVLEDANPYLLRSLSEHCALAGESGIGLVRELSALAPEAFRPDLAETLMDVAFGLTHRLRWEDAALLGREGSELFGTLAGENPRERRPDYAQSLNVLAHIECESDAERALKTVTRAAEEFRALSRDDPTAHRPGLALCLYNLRAIHGRRGDRQGAFRAMAAAVANYRLMARNNPVAYLPELAWSLLDLAFLQKENQDVQAALGTLSEAVGTYRGLTTDNPAAYLAQLATAHERFSELASTEQASALYTSSERALSEHPEAARKLACDHARLLLARTGGTDHELRTLIGLTDPAQRCGSEDSTPLLARQSLRNHRRTGNAAAEQVDGLWRTVTGGEPPDWLEIPDASFELAIDWVALPTWAEARRFWDTHGDLLQTATVTAALEDLALIDKVAELRLAVAREAAADGPDAAFRAHLSTEFLTVWRKIPTWPESRQYLTEHSEFILDDRALELLGSTLATPRQVEHFAVATLARADGIPAAYQYIEDRAALRARLERLLNSPGEPNSPDLLLAIAFIEFSVYREAFTGQAHGRLAFVLEGNDVDAGEWHHSRLDERNRFIDDIACAFKHHPHHHAALAALIASIRASASPQPL
ncbi:caspase family protein [Streptomyces sp. CLCI03]